MRVKNVALQLLVKRREEEESGEAETRIQARVLPPYWDKEGGSQGQIWAEGYCFGF